MWAIMIIFEIALSIDGEGNVRWGELHESTILGIQIFFFYRK